MTGSRIQVGGHSDASAVVSPAPFGLIGRAAELGRLRELVADVAAGRGRSAWLEGEPGIGKTALLEVGLRDAEAMGCHLFMGRADETDPMFPLRALLDALQVGPDATDPARAEIVERLWGGSGAGVMTPMDPVTAAAELVQILVDRLCAAGPVVLVVDDLQWADGTSLAVWGRLARTVGQLPLLLVAAARPVPRREEIERLRRTLAGTQAVDLTLGPLDSDQVAAVVRGLVSVLPGPGLLDLVGQAAGNPLYVRELVDALTREGRIEVRGGIADLVAGATAGSVSLTAAINARLSFLSQPATTVLRAAALLGVEFRVDHLSALTGEPATSLTDTIDEAIDGGVLAESGRALAFRHGLIQNALYESMPPEDRGALHERAAKSLATAGARVEAVAAQLLAAPDAHDWTVEWLGGAAPALITRAAQVAADLLQQALRKIGPADPRRIPLEVHLIDAHSRLGQFEEVESLAPQVLTQARDPEVIGRVTWALAYGLRVLGKYERALEVTGQATAGLVTTTPWQARIRALHASMLFTNARYDEAQSAADQAEADGQRAGDRVAIGWALFTAAQVQRFHHMDGAEALKLSERAAAVLGDDPEATDLRLLLLVNRASFVWNLGRRTEAKQLHGQSLVLAERTATPQRLASLRLMTAEIAFLEGRWDDALAELETAADPTENPAALTQLMLRGLAALIAVHRNDQASIRAHLGSGHDAGMPPEAKVIADRLPVAQALEIEREGRPGPALAILLDLFDPEATLLFQRITDCIWMIETVRLALAVGNRTVAEAAARACAREAGRQELPDALASAEHCRGLVEADPARLLSAAESFDRLGYAHFRAAAQEGAAVLLAQRGDAVAARAAYIDAMRTYADLGADWDIRRAEARIRPLGIHRGGRSAGRRPTSGWEALTPTEAKIAQLVAAGKTNADIAGDLYLSRRTVEVHVSHILRKLECRSRIDIAHQALTRRSET